MSRHLSGNPATAFSEKNTRLSGDVFLVDPLEDARWDGFVQNHPFGKLSHLSGWKRVLEGSFRNMTGFYPALCDGPEGEIKAALPIFFVKGAFTGGKLVSIPFATLCDPLASTAGEMAELLAAATVLMGKEAASSMEIRAFESAPLIRENTFCRHCFQKNHYLILDREPDELRKSFHRSCVRQRISRAEQSGLSIKTGEDEADLKKFYRLYVLTRRRLGFPPQPYEFFEMLWRVFAPEKRITLLLAAHGNKVAGGLMLFKFRDRVSAEFMAWDATLRAVSPAHYLFWEAIKSACREGFKVFDFGATSPNNRTLMDFKSRWGTSVADMPRYYYPGRALDFYEEREKSLAYKITRKVCRVMPSGILNGFGFVCYRYFG